MATGFTAKSKISNFSRWVRQRALTLCAFFLLAASANAARPFGSATFHCISVYWNPSSVDSTKKVMVKYRIANTQQWHEGYPIAYNHVPEAGLHQKAVYRGSVVNLTPNTTYEITLTEEGSDETETLILSTLNENIGGSVQFRMTGNRNTPLTVDVSGTPGKYKVYDGVKLTIDLKRSADDGIVVDADWVIIRNFTVTNTKRHGINILAQHHHIVIEDCDISRWGDLDRGTWKYLWKKGTEATDDDEWLTGPNQDTIRTQYGADHHSAIYNQDTWEGPGATNVVVQRNKIHHPNYDTNNWSEPNGNPYNPNTGNKEPNSGWKHPHGPGAVFLHSSGGGNVIRYNELWSDADHYFHDGIGGGYNSGWYGYPGPDSDIYGNYISYCNDDGFEIEGGAQNIRIWNNYTENAYVGFANAAVRIGPIYVWRNVFGNGTIEATGGRPSLYNIKMGSSGRVDLTGKQYFFNNTWYSSNGGGYEGVGTTGGNNRDVKHTVFRNNIFQTRYTDRQAISRSAANIDNDFDYDLISAPASTFPAGHEIHGVSGAPTFVSGWGLKGRPGESGFSGVFALAEGSRGKDAAQAIPNFCDVYEGTGLDMGAHEYSSEAMRFGVTAVFTPPAPSRLPRVSSQPARKVRTARR